MKTQKKDLRRPKSYKAAVRANPRKYQNTGKYNQENEARAKSSCQR
jgi:hypothetical protein